MEVVVEAVLVVAEVVVDADGVVASEHDAHVVFWAVLFPPDVGEILLGVEGFCVLLLDVHGGV